MKEGWQKPMQTTKDIAALLNIPAASVRRMKQALGLVEEFHFVKQGNRLLWTTTGADALSAYVHANPFAGLLDDNDLWGADG
jgi:hypothetical protein